jgi:hypothetical protein
MLGHKDIQENVAPFEFVRTVSNCRRSALQPLLSWCQADLIPRACGRPPNLQKLTRIRADPVRDAIISRRDPELIRSCSSVRRLATRKSVTMTAFRKIRGLGHDLDGAPSILLHTWSCTWSCAGSLRLPNRGTRKRSSVSRSMACWTTRRVGPQGWDDLDCASWNAFLEGRCNDRRKTELGRNGGGSEIADPKARGEKRSHGGRRSGFS